MWVILLECFPEMTFETKRLCFVDRVGAYAIWGVVTPIAEELINQGSDVTFVRMGDLSNRTPMQPLKRIRAVDIGKSIDEVRAPSSLAMQLRFGREFTRYLKFNKPDLVHTNFAVPGIIARYLAAHHGIKVVTTHHELYGSMSTHYRLGTRLTQGCADALVYVSNVVKDSFPPVRNAANQPKQYVIHNGIDIDAIAQLRGRGKPLRKTHELLCVGRLVPEKGQHLLVQALAELKDVYPELRVRFMGSGPDE